jgi:hypothetical protein
MKKFLIAASFLALTSQAFAAQLYPLRPIQHPTMKACRSLLQATMGLSTDKIFFRGQCVGGDEFIFKSGKLVAEVLISDDEVLSGPVDLRPLGVDDWDSGQVSWLVEALTLLSTDQIKIFPKATQNQNRVESTMVVLDKE